MASEDVSAEEMLDQVLGDFKDPEPEAKEPEAQAVESASSEEAAPASDQPDEQVEGAEEVEAKAEEPEAEEAKDPEEPADLSQKSQDRFRKLANERNELRAQLESQQAQMAQIQQQVQQQLYQAQLQAQQQARSRQEELAAQQLEILRSQQVDSQKRAERERYESMSVADQWKHDTQEAALKQAEKQFASKFQSLEQKFAQLEQKEQQAAEASRRQQNLAAFTNRSREAAQPLVEIFSEQERQAKIADFDDAILTYAAAYAITPEEASKKFKALLDSYADAKIKGKSRKQPLAAKPGVVPPKSSVPLRGSNTGAKDNEKPSWEQLRKHGYDDYLDWLDGGQPPLT